MTETREIHLVTATRILCGARLTEPWTVSDDRVTCDACRSLMLERSRERRDSVRLAVDALTRIMRET